MYQNFFIFIRDSITHCPRAATSRCPPAAP